MQHPGEAVWLQVRGDAGWAAQWAGNGVQLFLQVPQPAVPHSWPHHWYVLESRETQLLCGRWEMGELQLSGHIFPLICEIGELNSLPAQHKSDSH